MGRRKGVPRAEQHDWQPGAADMVQCSKCGHLASADQARRGIGPCPGKPDTVGSVPDSDQAPVPDSPEKAIPNGAQPVYQEEHLVGYIIPGSTSVTFLDGQPPVIVGGGPREVASICDTCGRTRPQCGNDSSTVQRAMNDDILECSDWRDKVGVPGEPDKPPEPPPVVIPQPGPNYIEPEENCNACHGRLAIIPLSPRLSFVGCPNRGCDLWRERLRWYPRQDRNPRRRRASRAEG